MIYFENYIPVTKSQASQLFSNPRFTHVGWRSGRRVIIDTITKQPVGFIILDGVDVLLFAREAYIRQLANKRGVDPDTLRAKVLQTRTQTNWKNSNRKDTFLESYIRERGKLPKDQSFQYEPEPDTAFISNLPTPLDGASYPSLAEVVQSFEAIASKRDHTLQDISGVIKITEGWGGTEASPVWEIQVELADGSSQDPATFTSTWDRTGVVYYNGKLILSHLYDKLVTHINNNL